MPRKSKSNTPNAPTWTPEELLAVKHLGPAIIGQEKYDAAQAYIASTSGGRFGPALISDDPAYSQAGPIRIEDGVPVFAEQT